MVERDNQWIGHAIIQVEGTHLAPQYMNALLEVGVDTSLHLPSMCVLRFLDDQLELIDANVLTPGKKIKIEFGYDRASLKTVFSGEITSIEPEFTQLTTVFTVRGYDRSHRLNRGAKTRAFIQMKDSDIVKQIAGEAGLQPDVSETSQVFEHIFQDNQTDLAFLQERARLLGYEVFVDEDKLYFRPPQGGRGNLSLKWGETLIDFFPRMTLARQVNEVTVKGWDYSQKRAIVGKASNSQSVTRIGAGQAGGALAQRAFSSAANHLIVRQPVVSQAQADRIAQAALNDINAEFVEAEGVAFGDPNLVAGKIINVQNLGQRFSGDYMVTSAVHVYSQDGYEVHFRVEGAYARTMSDLVTKSKPAGEEHQVWAGVYSAIITNNSDPQNLGRVKVKFPWMDDTLESGWVRVVGLGAGNQRGLFWLPEVNDEVLIAFEHGEFNHPYVIGNLWNGQDKPPDNTSNVVKGGKVETRLLKTRTGHMIKLVDESGSSYIEIVDHNGNNQIKLDTNNNKLIIKTKGNLEMESTGDAILKGTGNVSVEGNQNITLKATSNVNIEATASLTIKGTANVSVESSGTLTIKGAIVKIN